MHTDTTPSGDLDNYRNSTATFNDNKENAKAVIK